VAESTFFEPQDDEAFKLWKNNAFQDFNRELGLRVSKRKTQELFGSFLNKQEGSQESLEEMFQSFPGSAKEKALRLLNKYKTGFEPAPLNPWEIASKENIFQIPDFGSTSLDPYQDKLLSKWLGIHDPKKIDNLVEDTSFAGESVTNAAIHPWRTGGEKIDVLANESIENPGTFYKEIKNSGATPKELQHLQNYIYNEDVRTKSGKFKKDVTKSIDSLAQKASESQSWASFPEKQYVLFRGENIKKSEDIPELGAIYSKDRPTSFAASLSSTDQFMGGMTHPDKNPGRKVLYAVTEYSDEAKPKLLIPGQESEIIAPSSSKFKVIGKAKLQNHPGFYNPETDIELIKLKQLYGLDPAGAAIQGGKNLLRRNVTGAALGASTALLNPEVSESVKKDRYGEAAGVVARDVVGGALTEAGIKAAAPTAARYAPGLVRAAAPFARFAGPVATGAALFSQGQKKSLTDVIIRKAAENPIPFTPRVNPDPKTDVGRRAGNELLYMFNQLGRGKIPYTAK